MACAAPSLPPTAPPDPAKALRRSLGQFATGVAVITVTTDSGAVDGMTVNSFSALSLDPPLILWSIRRNASSLAQYTQAEHFAVNVLAEDQIAVSRHFSTPAATRAGQPAHQRGAHGTPLLHGAIAHFECARHAVLEGGDHFIIIGRVLNHASHPGEPLLFAQGQYACVRSHPQGDAPLPATLAQDSPPAAHFLRLLSQASERTAHAFRHGTDTQDWQSATARVLVQLQRASDTLDALQQHTLLGRAAVEAALEQLLRQGHVRTADGHTWQLTPAGEAVCDRLLQAMGRFAERTLDPLDAADLQAATRVLARLGVPA